MHPTETHDPNDASMHLAPMRAATMSLPVAAELQDHLLAASHDLDRLQALLAHAGDALMLGFHGATEGLGALAESLAMDSPSAAARLGPIHRQLATAVPALQFQDMASQLIAHTNQRLRHCADRIAGEAMGGHDGEGSDDDGPDGEPVIEPAPLRPNPVTQDEMDAGSVELF